MVYRPMLRHEVSAALRGRRFVPALAEAVASQVLAGLKGSTALTKRPAPAPVPVVTQPVAPSAPAEAVRMMVSDSGRMVHAMTYPKATIPAAEAVVAKAPEPAPAPVEVPEEAKAAPDVVSLPEPAPAEPEPAKKTRRAHKRSVGPAKAQEPLPDVSGIEISDAARKLLGAFEPGLGFDTEMLKQRTEQKPMIIGTLTRSLIRHGLLRTDDAGNLFITRHGEAMNARVG